MSYARDLGLEPEKSQYFLSFLLLWTYRSAKTSPKTLFASGRRGASRSSGSGVGVAYPLSVPPVAPAPAPVASLKNLLNSSKNFLDVRSWSSGSVEFENADAGRERKIWSYSARRSGSERT